MVDINIYRHRIGVFSQTLKIRKCLVKSENHQSTVKSLKNILQITSRILLVTSVLVASTLQQKVTCSKFQQGNTGVYIVQSDKISELKIPCSNFQQESTGVYIVHSDRISELRRFSKRTTVNFKARYKFGNQDHRVKGIKNFHVNIRSLGNKISEVRNIVKQHSPHILGISEAELRKVQNFYDEKKLKIPGYDLLFPNSWEVQGYARVVVYVKSSLHYQQVHDLQDDVVQSVWLQGGFKNSKGIYVCHGYREHSSSLGSSIQSQRQYLETFLNQWEEAIVHNNPRECNEVHVAGDMNIDVLDNKWLRPDYHLITLSRILQSVCNAGNFSQLVSEPTRAQFNSRTGGTDLSTIDHIYTNYKFRCSRASVTAFGSSDHDLIGYTRFSKDPASPAKTIRKRTYKKFNPRDFLTDLRNVDWSDVFVCDDVDHATEILTLKFKSVLDHHAPWKVFQHRKKYVPWLTEETIQLMKARDEWKHAAVSLAKSGQDATEAWAEFKKIRNQVNNRRKFEEKAFKSAKITSTLHSAAETWRTVKNFMEFDNNSGPPSQLCINGVLITKAAHIASEINNFFINKVRLIREGINQLPTSFVKCLEIMNSKHCRLSLCHVSVSKVNKLLKNLNNSRSSSIDGLDSYCVKVAADVVAEPLHHIISLSINQSKFPTSWKYSKIIPLHKKDSKLEAKNYRPVAILSPFSKILEKISYEQIYDFFSRNQIFHPSLHGYRQHRSTQTALLSMYGG